MPRPKPTPSKRHRLRPDDRQLIANALQALLREEQASCVDVARALYVFGDDGKGGGQRFAGDWADLVAAFKALPPSHMPQSVATVIALESRIAELIGRLP